MVTFGPGPKFKGGITNYNTSLAKAFDKMEGTEVHIVSWTQQYPAIIPRDFIDRKSKTNLIEGTSIQVHYITNYNNPFSWYRTYRLIKSLNPGLIVFQWAIAIQGLPLGWIARRLVKKTNTEVIFDLHFVHQKEGSSLDMLFTRMGIRHAHTYIVHSYKTANELKELFPQRDFIINEYNNRDVPDFNRVIKLFHPVYDMYQPDPDFDIPGQKKILGLGEHVYLFFGFIRKYKGLHYAIKAFAELARIRDDVSLLIVGESFWHTLDSKKVMTKLKNLLFGLFKSIFLRKKDDERNYRPLDLIDELDIRNKVCLVNEFVPNEEVHKYFQVSDCILLFYETATPSGVESMACNFKLPILASAVGHFPETIKDGYNGYLAEPENIHSMADVMQKALDKPIDRENVVAASKEMSWANYAKAILR
jgi:glycosyltransferase involved in cell wall biosynthesis